ncbi:MAG: RNA-binding protein [Alphaproteobacteria bacterium]
MNTAAQTCADDAPGAGARRRLRHEPERRCIVTGARGDAADLLRFVVGPGQEVVPDLDGKLPGRGLWVTADAATVAEAVRRRAFARAAKAAVNAADDLADRVGGLLTDRLIAAVALARRAGDAVCGYEKVRAVLHSGRASVLLSARDRQADGARKLRALAQALDRPVPLVDLLDADQLGRPFGRQESVHAAIAAGPMTTKVMGAAGRLARYRGLDPVATAGGGDSEAR